MELLALTAVRALEVSDVVLLDDLVNREVLQVARTDTQVTPVRKRGGCKSTAAKSFKPDARRTSKSKSCRDSPLASARGLGAGAEILLSRTG